MSKMPQLAESIGALPRKRSGPLWQGPEGQGPEGGVTQSMLSRWLTCRERFRVKYVLGLEPSQGWSKSLGYGNMWHVCEEGFAKAGQWSDATQALLEYAQAQIVLYPLQREEIEKWWNVCLVQFPEYIKYWREHPDVLQRRPLTQEEPFDVPYSLPSGRVVRLRGKFDSVDEIQGWVWLQENKTKGDIDELLVQRQLRFDLQTMLYLIALLEGKFAWKKNSSPLPLRGVRYNVVRRPLSGGKGSIRPHAAKSTKTKYTPAESQEEYYERLRRDYIAAEPEYWFFRVNSEVSHQDVTAFRKSFLDAALEQMCWWYDVVVKGYQIAHLPLWAANYRMPFGVYNPLTETGASEYDAYLETGSESGMRSIDTCFPELE